jgi:hypothetical protein
LTFVILVLLEIKDRKMSKIDLQKNSVREIQFYLDMSPIKGARFGGS